MTDGVDGVVAGVATRTLDEAPLDEATHWTAAAMARASGLSVSLVQRIWRAQRPATPSGPAL